MRKDVFAQGFAKRYLQDDGEEFEVLCHNGVCFGKRLFSLDQVADEGLVVCFQFVDLLSRCLPLAGGDGVPDLHKGIGGTAQGAEYYDLRLCLFSDQLAYLQHTFGPAYGGTSEFHYFHLIYFLERPHWR